MAEGLACRALFVRRGPVCSTQSDVEQEGRYTGKRLKKVRDTWVLSAIVLVSPLCLPPSALPVLDCLTCSSHVSASCISTT